MIKPPHLKSRDRVALVAPASRPLKPFALRRAEAMVREMGFTPVIGDHILDTHGYMAGTDEHRLSDLKRAMLDDSIRAIWPLTGGFGCLPLLPELPYAAFAAAPKIIIGSEDNSHLTAAVATVSGVVTLHGPNCDRVDTRASFDSVKRALTHCDYPEMTTRDSVLEHFASTAIEGVSKGQTLPVNLTSLVSLFGTPYEPRLDGRLLFLEDADERNDILDRWFTTLYISGKLSTVAAMGLGRFDRVDSRGASNMLSFEELVYDRVMEMGLNTCFDLPFGQSGDTAIMPLGVWAVLEMDSRQVKLVYSESVLS